VEYLCAFLAHKNILFKRNFNLNSNPAQAIRIIIEQLLEVFHNQEKRKERKNLLAA